MRRGLTTSTFDYIGVRIAQLKEDREKAKEERERQEQENYRYYLVRLLRLYRRYAASQGRGHWATKGRTKLFL